MLNDFVEGLLIIQQRNPETDLSAEHDVIYVGDSNKFSQSEKEKLESLGFYVSEVEECFKYIL